MSSRRLIPVAVALACVLSAPPRPAHAVPAEGIRLRSGEVVDGRILEIRPDSGLLMRLADGSERLVRFEEMDGVQRSRFEPGPRSLNGLVYGEGGVCIGAPGNLNLMVGLSVHRVGMLLSAGGLTHGLGKQAFLGLKLGHTTRGYHALGAFLGNSRYAYDDHRSTSYLGVAYNRVVGGLFLSLGLGRVSPTGEGCLFIQLGVLERLDQPPRVHKRSPTP